MSAPPPLFIGAMSGTSLDGIDAVLAAWHDQRDDAALQVLAHVHRPYPAALRDELLALNEPGRDELHRAQVAANAVAIAYAGAVRGVLEASGVAADTVVAIGAHGQTVRHRPHGDPADRYSVQLLNAALLAELTGVDVISDFRSRDVAAGGQGAPLVPAFHAARFAVPGVERAVLNLGGIANLTLLHADGQIGGFDCGPGNALMDLWTARHLGVAMDVGGRWAASGRVDPVLLEGFLGEPYLAREPPKSTGRDLFTTAWLGAKLAGATDPLPADVQATLAELTARAAADALRRHAASARDLLVCGGGAFNDHLLARLRALLPDVAVRSSADEGLPPDQVEAAAFAWLARAFLARRNGNRVEVTGASGPRVLGALHPGRGALV